MITRNLHSPLKIEIVLKAHYHPKFTIRRDYTAEQEVASQLFKDGILALKGTEDYDTGYYTLTEKGKVFLDMILNTPYPIQKWVDPNW